MTLRGKNKSCRTDGQNYISKTRSLPVRLAPVLLLLVGVWFLVRNLSYDPQSYLKPPFVVPPALFEPLNGNEVGKRPAYIPPPVAPKARGMVVPNAVHYVYGLKPVPEGEKADELPYYAYLAIRSAMVNIKPEAIYLWVYLYSFVPSPGYISPCSLTLVILLLLISTFMAAP